MEWEAILTEPDNGGKEGLDPVNNDFSHKLIGSVAEAYASKIL